MGSVTKIQWCTRTLNPWWGCSVVGPGCDHCYAEAFDKRTGGGHWGPGAPRRRTSEKNWNEALKWDAHAARTGEIEWVFVASMADVFDNEVDPVWRTDLWELIRRTPNLRYQLLTKRIGNALKMLPRDFPSGFEHVGIMATIVTADELDRDGPKLIDVKAHGATWVGISYEPALEPVDFNMVLYPGIDGSPTGYADWIICGGESGPNARPFNPEWARSAIAQTRDTTTAVFVKQMGAAWAKQNRARDGHGGDMMEWPEDLRVREMPAEHLFRQPIGVLL